MVITLEQKRRRQQLSVVLFLGTVFAIAVILYLNFLKPNWIPLSPATPAPSDIGPSMPPKDLIVRPLILDKALIDELKPPNFESNGILPIEVGDLGRENPFIPY